MSIDFRNVRLMPIYQRLIYKYQHKINVKKGKTTLQNTRKTNENRKKQFPEIENLFVDSHFTRVAIENRCWQFFSNDSLILRNNELEPFSTFTSTSSVTYAAN